MTSARRPARGSTWLLALLVVGIAAGCAPALPAATPAATPTPLPSALPVLPPTWTPTHTATPPPPTATPTVTHSPTPTAILTADDLCAAFALFSHPRQGVFLPWEGAVTFVWQFPLGAASVTLRLTRLQSDETLLLTVPGPSLVVAEMPFHALYGHGEYAWSVAPNDEAGQPIADCAVEGRFYIRERAPEPEDVYPGAP